MKLFSSHRNDQSLLNTQVTGSLIVCVFLLQSVKSWAWTIRKWFSVSASMRPSLVFWNACQRLLPKFALPLWPCSSVHVARKDMRCRRVLARLHAQIKVGQMMRRSSLAASLSTSKVFFPLLARLVDRNGCRITLGTTSYEWSQRVPAMPLSIQWQPWNLPVMDTWKRILCFILTALPLFLGVQPWSLSLLHSVCYQFPQQKSVESLFRHPASYPQQWEDPPPHHSILIRSSISQATIRQVLAFLVSNCFADVRSHNRKWKYWKTFLSNI